MGSEMIFNIVFIMFEIHIKKCPDFPDTFFISDQYQFSVI